MASLSQGAIPRPFRAITGRGGLVDKYFYFSMSLLIAAIVVWGFSHSINESLFHPAIPRPLLLWIHAAVFSAWVVFYISQSVLVRTRNVKLHRRLGWFGAGLAGVMVPLGLAIAVIMGRFDKHVLHFTDADQFLSVPFGDMVMFGICVGLAIAWRKTPDLHRRLLFIATCALLDAPFDRIDYIFDHDLGFICLDAVILLGMVRDLVVDRRIHKVYLAAMPPMVIFQAILIYLYRGAPEWWLGIGRRILG
jgi:hypothetical protein